MSGVILYYTALYKSKLTIVGAQMLYTQIYAIRAPRELAAKYMRRACLLWCVAALYLIETFVVKFVKSVNLCKYHRQVRPVQIISCL